jgi:hypothetical protein
MLSNYRYLTSREYCVGGFELCPKSVPQYLNVRGYRTVCVLC